MIAIVSMAITGALLLLAQDQDTLRVRSPIDAGDTRHPAYLAALIGAPLTAGNAFEVLQNGDAAFSRMLADIHAAQHRISFESFIYGDGDVSAAFTDALARAARRGVDVRIVLDAFGSADLPAGSQAALADAGVRVAWFNPVRPWTLEETNYRTHRKVLVVDGHAGYTGGMGLAILGAVPNVKHLESPGKNESTTHAAEAFRERAKTMRELFQGENERQSRLTSRYALLEPLRFHLERMLRDA